MLEHGHEAKTLYTSVGTATDIKSMTVESETGEPPHGYHLVCLMTFIPGEIFVNVPYTPSLLYQAGKHLASIEKALIVRCYNNLLLPILIFNTIFIIPKD